MTTYKGGGADNKVPTEIRLQRKMEQSVSPANIHKALAAEAAIAALAYAKKLLGKKSGT